MILIIGIMTDIDDIEILKNSKNINFFTKKFLNLITDDITKITNTISKEII